MAGHALYFHCAHGLATQVLASVSDSLVRVSRRVGCACSVRRDQRQTCLGSAMPPRAIMKCLQTRRTPRSTVHRFETAKMSRDTRHKRVSSCRFQALFNSLFKVLCIFPSRYLFAIGHEPIFSFRWNLPPNSSCNPKQPDSARAHRAAAILHGTGISPSPSLLFQGT